jgi:hypothetical protein
MRWLFACLVAVSLPLAAGTRARAEDNATACAAPAELTTPDTPLEHVRAAIAAGGPVNVLAVGSSSTVGSNSHDPRSAYPYRMIDALHAARPGVTFHLDVRGGRGLTAADMLPQLEKALKDQRYALVIWQTGTVEAVSGMPPDGLSDPLEQGRDLVLRAGANLIVVDPRFSRFLRANVDLDPYESALEQVASVPGVALFHRFDLMHAWVDDGRIDLERAPEEEREAVLAQLNTCVGEAMARFVLTGAALPPGG